MRRSWLVLAAVAAVAVSGAFAVHMLQRERQRSELARGLTGGDPERAPGLMRTYGCAGCHDIPGLAGPRGRVGPPLRGLSERVYVGGVATNTPENLVRWIVDPKQLSPNTAMPVTGISEAQARDVAAYLYAH